MAKDYTISVKGIDSLQDVIENAVKMEQIKDLVKLNTTEMQQKAQRFQFIHPTGNLKRNIIMEIKDSGMTGKVTSTVDYAAYVEYGTRFMYGRFYLKGAQEKQTAIFVRDLKRLME